MTSDEGRGRAGKGDGDDEEGDGPEKIEFTVVVNGSPVTFKEKAENLLSVVLERALKKRGNVGQPAENWELRDEQGVLLDPAREIEKYGFGTAVTLFLSLKAGVGG